MVKPAPKPKRIWTCCVCGKQAPWGKGWCYPVGIPDICCSEKCLNKRIDSYAPEAARPTEPLPAWARPLPAPEGKSWFYEVRQEAMSPYEVIEDVLLERLRDNLRSRDRVSGPVLAERRLVLFETILALRYHRSKR